MKLYAHPTAPQHNPFYTSSTPPARSYALLQQIRSAYEEMLYNWWSPDELYLACFPDLLTRRTRNEKAPAAAVVTKRLQAAEDRLGYELPELLEHMDPAELETAAEVLCSSTLPGFILHVLGLERMLHRRLKEPCGKRLNDDKHAKAAGLGKPVVAKAVKTPTPVRQPVVVRPVVAPVLRVARPAAYWKRVREKAQLTLWPLQVGSMGGAL